MSDPPSSSPSFSKDLYLLSATFFFIFMGAGAQQAYLVPYLRGVTDWSRLECSIVIAGVYLGMLIFRIANLYLFPGWSDRRFTVIGSLSYLSFTLLMFATAYLRSYPLAVGGAFLWGAGAAMMWTGTAMQTLAIADRAGGRHGTGMGILYSSTHAGWLVGAIVLGKIYGHLPAERSQLLYVAAAGITLIGNVMACFLPAAGEGRRETPSLSAIWEIFTRGRSLIAGILQCASALSYGLILGVFGDYIKTAYGANWIWISISLYPATRMVMSFVGGWLTDRVGHSPVLAGGFLLGAAGLYLTVSWHSPYAVVLTGFTLGMLGSAVPVVTSAIVGNAAERKRRPLAYGVIFSWRDLGVVAAAVGANILGLRLDLNAVFTVFMYVFAGCAVLSVYLGRFAKQDL